MNRIMMTVVMLMVSVPAVMAETTVYIPLGSANQVIAVDASEDKIIASYDGVDNPHGLVATPDGEYLVAGSLKEDKSVPAGQANSRLFLVHPAHGHVMSTIPVHGWTHHQAITTEGRYVIRDAR